MPSLSIVIPVYNIEKHISECVDSVLSQSFNDFEIILVDDGSTDAGGQVCDAYAEQHPKVSVIHKKNGGISSARNAGLEKAKGEYIWFFDGDDTCVPEVLSKVMPRVLKDKPDICVCGMNIATNNMQNIYPTPFFITEKMKSSNNALEIMNEYYRNYDGMWSAIRHIYRRDFIEKIGVVFDTGLGLAEDCEFNMTVFPQAESFLFIQEPLFNYRTNREGSLTTKRDFVFVSTNIVVFAKWIKHFSSLDKEVPMNHVVQHLAKMFYNNVIESLQIKCKSNRKYIFNLIRERKFVFKYIKGLKQKVFILFLLTFGLPMGRLLYLATHYKLPIQNKCAGSVQTGKDISQ